MLIMVALIGVLLLVVIALWYRLWKLRQVGGTAAILRDVPAVGGHGWRHGVMRYRGGEAGFYRLSSLRWWPDRRLSRRGLEIVSRRAPRGDEFDIMTDEIVVLELRDTSPERQRGYEVALDRGALTAFLSWLESRPSPRARRTSIVANPLAKRSSARLPQHVAVGIGHPGQNEQQIRQPVEVLGGQHADRRCRVGLHREPRRSLGSPRHGPGDMQQAPTAAYRPAAQTNSAPAAAR